MRNEKITFFQHYGIFTLDDSSATKYSFLSGLPDRIVRGKSDLNTSGAYWGKNLRSELSLSIDSSVINFINDMFNIGAKCIQQNTGIF